MRVKILDHFYEYVENYDALDPGDFGACDKPSAKNKKITIRPALDDRQHIETVIHEAFHAGFWPVSEEYVERFANDLARLLLRLGYKRCQES